MFAIVECGLPMPGRPVLRIEQTLLKERTAGSN
ncbi:hypothetical protein [Vibrio phage vB_VpaS_AL-2]|nr:hypothetical protein [Vibrio phage vB_VpaS_AL-2]